MKHVQSYNSYNYHCVIQNSCKMQENNSNYIYVNGQKQVLYALKILENYKWLLDSYVLDYFTEAHWKKLPTCWQETLQSIDPKELSSLLTPKTVSPKYLRVWPLSLLALSVAAQQYSVSRIQVSNVCYRKQVSDEQQSDLDLLCTSSHFYSKVSNKQDSDPKGTSCLMHPKLNYVFARHVKPKKRHEIETMTKLIASIAQEEGCQYIVDIGSGLGHLARWLAYGYGLRVCCLEANQTLTSQARVLDLELEASVVKFIGQSETIQAYRPVHLNFNLGKEVTADQLTELLLSSFKPSESNFRFGIVGLHPCGDLAPILIDLFINSPAATFISIVGCCYMKLTTNVSEFCGYPLSNYVRTLPHSLSFEAREVACHAVEMYSERLNLGQYDDLKVHCYRALLEKILVNNWPHLRHTAIKSIKHSNNLTFKNYSKVALEKLGLELPLRDLICEETENSLQEWKNVVTFYTLRLLLAPLVETVVLLDRLLYLLEKDIRSITVPVFDPKLSPRNNVLIGVKYNR